MTLLTAALILLVAAIGFSAGMMYSTIQELRRRLTSLEQSGPKRLPYKSAESIEDATAALIRLQSELDFRRDLVDNAVAHLQKARHPN